MSDFDTRRVGEIAVLEEKIQNLQRLLAAYKTDAERWTPVVNSDVNIDAEEAKISLTFGGKSFAAQMSYSWLRDMNDVTSITTAVVETLCASHVADRLRPLVEVEVRRVLNNALSVNGAGKW